MTYIGVAIFTVYFNVAGWSIDDTCLKQTTKCMDDAHAESHKEGTYESKYVGEFATPDECTKAVSKASYVAKKGESVDEAFEILCVPKPGDNSPKPQEPIISTYQFTITEPNGSTQGGLYLTSTDCLKEAQQWVSQKPATIECYQIDTIGERIRGTTVRARAPQESKP